MSRSSVSFRRRWQWSLGLLLGALLTLTLPVRSHAIDSIQTVDTNGQHTSVVLDANGFPVISYAGGGGLTLVHCNDANCAGNDESLQTIAPTVAGGIFYTSLVLDANGFPVILYMDGFNIRLVHCNDANCAGNDEDIQTIDFHSSCGPVRHSLVLDSHGFPVISYFSGFGADLKLMHCNDANCAGGDESLQTVGVGNFDQCGQYTSLVLDANDFPVISYDYLNVLGLTNTIVKLAHCNDANCAGNDESLQTVDADGSFPSLKLDATGFPVISYATGNVFPTGNNLKLMHCNDTNCAGNDESIQTVDAVWGAGEFTSLVLDASGFPVISYRDGANALKLAHCDDANCAGNDESLQTVDGFTQYTSLVLDAHGFPVISYGFFNFPNAALKLAHCDDANCAPNQPPVAQCHNVTVSTTVNTCAAASASINNGSSDPDNDPLTLTQVPAGPYPLGTTSVQLTVSDGTDSSQCSGTVTVVDGQAPTLTCPGNQTATATSSSGAPVSFALNATDNCGTVIPSCTPTSGSTFPIGTTSVTCTATDGAGLQNSCNFTVMVTATPLLQTTALIATVDNLPVSTAIKVALKAPLQVARVALQNNQPQVACGSLRVFEAVVNQLRQANRLTAAQAAQLTTSSQSIRISLGCA